jgi:hypothetical protein
MDNSNDSEAIHKKSDILEQHIVSLLEERLAVTSKKYKTSEVICRKIVETRMIEIPVRRERLIVEQIYPEYKQLAEIGLVEEEVPEVTQVANFANGTTTRRDFSSIQSAMQFLDTIGCQSDCQKIQITVSITPLM